MVPEILVLLASLLFSLGLASLARAEVTLSAGQSITISPGAAPTVVSCAGPAPAPKATAPKTESEAFCYCRPLALQGSVDFNLVKVSGGSGAERSETTLKNYASAKACDQAIAAYPACR